MSANIIVTNTANLNARREEAKREKRLLLAAIILCLLALPLSILSPARNLLYALVVILELLFLMVDFVLKDESPGGVLSVSFPVLATCLFGYLICCWLLNGGNAAERIIQTAMFLLTLTVFSRFEWDMRSIRTLKRVFGVLVIASAVWWLATTRATNYYSAFYGHSNGFAVILICAIVVTLFSVEGRVRPADVLLIALCLVMLVFANSRSAILCLVALCAATGIFFVAGRRSGSYRAVATVVFAITVVGVLAFTVVYPSLYGTQLGGTLEMLSREYFNKNFFSGRQVVWSMVLNALAGHELFGLGLHYTPSMLYDTAYSSHNLYLQTLMQSGIVGLALVLAILYICMRQFGDRFSWQACVGAALIVGVLVHECLEVSLTQNNFTVGIMFWAIIGVSLALSARPIARGRA